MGKAAAPRPTTGGPPNAILAHANCAVCACRIASLVVTKTGTWRQPSIMEFNENSIKVPPTRTKAYKLL